VEADSTIGAQLPAPRPGSEDDAGPETAPEAEAGVDAGARQASENPAPGGRIPEKRAPADQDPENRAPADQGSENAGPANQTPADGAAPGLGPRERAILDFAVKRWKHAGSKDQAIRDTFQMSPNNYQQFLNTLLDHPAALAYRPSLVLRLRRERDARRDARG
jgi:hypothetical protein